MDQHDHYRDLTDIRRRRQGRFLVKKCVSILLWNFSLIYLDIDLSSVFVDINTCPYWIRYECVQFQIEIWKISRCGSRSPDNAELGHFTLLFCRERQRNVQRIITHVHSHCSAHQAFCLVTFSLPLPSCFAWGPYFGRNGNMHDGINVLR